MVADRSGRGARSYLSSFAHELGEAVPLADLADESVRAKLGELHGQGLRHCRVSDESAVEMAARSGGRTVELVGADAVDAVVFCTDTPPATTATNEAWELLIRLGLPRTPVTVVGGSGCGNLGAGFTAARGLLALGAASTVLVVTADRVHAGPRYLANGQTVMSDGAASCVVSSRPLGPGYELRSAAAGFRADVGRVAARPAAVARATAEAVRSVVRESLRPLSLTASDIRHVLTGNYGRSAREFLAMSAGVPVERFSQAAVERNGHCFAADALVDLEYLVETGQVRVGEHVVLLTMSPRSWSVVVATRGTGE